MGITLDLNQFKNFFSFIDVDGDGFISFHEFCKINLDKSKCELPVQRIKRLVRPLVNYSQHDERIVEKQDVF